MLLDTSFATLFEIGQEKGRKERWNIFGGSDWKGTGSFGSQPD